MKRRADPIARLRDLGAPDEAVVVPLDEFLEGNDDDGSFAANVGELIAAIAERLRYIQARPEVHAVYPVIVDLMDEDENSWPYADQVLIYASAPEEEVRNWFGTKLAPDELGKTRVDEGPSGAPQAPDGLSVYLAWWD